MSKLTHKYTHTARSAFAYERPAFAYVIILTFNRFKPITTVRHNNDLAKEWLRIYPYTYEKGTGLIALRTCKVHLTAYLLTRTDTDTDKYDLKARRSTLRTVTNSFTLRARNQKIELDQSKWDLCWSITDQKLSSYHEYRLYKGKCMFANRMSRPIHVSHFLQLMSTHRR